MGKNPECRKKDLLSRDDYSHTITVMRKALIKLWLRLLRFCKRVKKCTFLQRPSDVKWSWAEKIFKMHLLKIYFNESHTQGHFFCILRSDADFQTFLVWKWAQKKVFENWGLRFGLFGLVDPILKNGLGQIDWVILNFRSSMENETFSVFQPLWCPISLQTDPPAIFQEKWRKLCLPSFLVLFFIKFPWVFLLRWAALSREWDIFRTSPALRIFSRTHFSWCSAFDRCK